MKSRKRAFVLIDMLNKTFSDIIHGANLIGMRPGNSTKADCEELKVVDENSGDLILWRRVSVVYFYFLSFIVNLIIYDQTRTSGKMLAGASPSKK